MSMYTEKAAALEAAAQVKYYAFFIFVLSTYQSAPVIHTEEYVPHTIPTIKGNANSLIEVTPRTYSAATIIKVVNDVKILLESV